jgi:hypothetical protein
MKITKLKPVKKRKVKNPLPLKDPDEGKYDSPSISLLDSPDISLEDKENLVINATVNGCTLNGIPARIAGIHLQFPEVFTIEEPYITASFAWNTIKRVSLENDAQFKSTDTKESK